MQSPLPSMAPILAVALAVLVLAVPPVTGSPAAAWYNVPATLLARAFKSRDSLLESHHDDALKSHVRDIRSHDGGHETHAAHKNHASHENHAAHESHAGHKTRGSHGSHDGSHGSHTYSSPVSSSSHWGAPSAVQQRQPAAGDHSVGQGVYLNNFSRTLINLLSSLNVVSTSSSSSPHQQSKQTVVKGVTVPTADGQITITKDPLQSLTGGLAAGLAMLAAVGAGLAALIAFVIPPLQIANQILAIIAIALLVAYIIEDKHYKPKDYKDYEDYGDTAYAYLLGGYEQGGGYESGYGGDYNRYNSGDSYPYDSASSTKGSGYKDSAYKDSAYKDSAYKDSAYKDSAYKAPVYRKDEESSYEAHSGGDTAATSHSDLYRPVNPHKRTSASASSVDKRHRHQDDLHHSASSSSHKRPHLNRVGDLTKRGEEEEAVTGAAGLKVERTAVVSSAENAIATVRKPRIVGV